MSYNVEKYENLITDEELEIILSSYYTEEDWERNRGIVRNHYTLQNNFTNKEHAKEVINRILTVIKKIR